MTIFFFCIIFIAKFLLQNFDSKISMAKFLLQNLLYQNIHFKICIAKLLLQTLLQIEVLVYTYLYLYINMRNINNEDLSNIQLKMSE